MYLLLFMTQKLNYKKIFAIILELLLLEGFIFFVAPSLVEAQSAADPNRSAIRSDLVPCGNADSTDGAPPVNSDVPNGRPCTIYDIFKLIARITNFLIALAGVFAVFFIVKAGLSMVAAVGDPGKLTAAKHSLLSAVIGFVLVFAAFLLVNTILNGSLSLGIKGGASILTNPFDYIKGTSSK